MLIGSTQTVLLEVIAHVFDLILSTNGSISYFYRVITSAVISNNMHVIITWVGNINNYVYKLYVYEYVTYHLYNITR